MKKQTFIRTIFTLVIFGIWLCLNINNPFNFKSGIIEIGQDCQGNSMTVGRGIHFGHLSWEDFVYWHGLTQQALPNLQTLEKSRKSMCTINPDKIEELANMQARIYILKEQLHLQTIEELEKRFFQKDMSLTLQIILAVIFLLVEVWFLTNKPNLSEARDLNLRKLIIDYRLFFILFLAELHAIAIILNQPSPEHLMGQSLVNVFVTVVFIGTLTRWGWLAKKLFDDLFSYSSGQPQF
ncbi:MAG: hypothetical protein NXI23_26875 [Bacteroidetes bacterium]|nr:hypothetical protein [Bacteroidota bacterium]